MMKRLPRMECRRAEAGEELADEGDLPWRALEAQELWKTEDGGAPVRGTRVRTFWDERRVGILFEVCDEAPWATLTERGAPLYTEEVVEVFLDPVGDGEAYYELEVNLQNAVLEACVRRVRSGYRKDFRWRCEGLETGVRRTAEGWVAELRIPFGAVSASVPRVGERWRVNFTRIDRPPGVPRELTAWSPTGLAQFHVPQRFGILEFV